MLENGLKVCSVCDRPMKKRMKHTGDDAGVEFWVCSRFPECRNVERCEGMEVKQPVEPVKIHTSSWADKIQPGSQPKRLNNMDQEGKPYAKIGLFLGSAVFFAFILAGYIKVDLKSLVFGNIGKRSTDTGLVDYPKQQKAEIQPGQTVATSEQESKMYSEGTFYKYTDENGVVAIVNDVEKVPSRYRANMKVSAPSGYKGSPVLTNYVPAVVTELPKAATTASGVSQTAVVVKGNRLYAPVTIGYRGRMVTTYLIVDTGASDISISQEVAQQLGIKQEAGRESIITVANGSTVASYNAIADFVAVGSKSKKSLIMHVMPPSGSGESGLLGMSFLGDFPHMIDTKAQVIKWM